MLKFIKERPLLALNLLTCLAVLLIPGFGPFGVCMGMSIVSNVRSNPATTGSPTGAIDSTSRVVDMSDTIHLLDPNEAPLTAITMKLRKAHCISPKVEWLEDDYLPASSAVQTSTASTSTTLVVTAGQGPQFRQGDVVNNLNTGETFYVSSRSTDTLTIVRGIGTTAATMTANDVLLIVGNANEEGTTSREAKTTTKTALSNFTQIFRWPFGITGTLDSTEVYGGSDLNYQTRKGGIEHRINMERAFMFGYKADLTAPGSGAGPIRYCDGLVARITTNGGSTMQTLSTTTIETFLRQGMRYGPARKVLFASRLAMSYINVLATGKIVTVPTTSSFPLALTEYISPHGKIYLVTHNLLEGSTGLTVKYQGYAFLLDMDSIFYRYLRGRDTKLRTNIQAPDADARKDEYLTEACPMIIQEKNHSIAHTITTQG